MQSAALATESPRHASQQTDGSFPGAQGAAGLALHLIDEVESVADAEHGN